MKMFARVGSTILPSQPFPEEQVSTCMLGAKAGAAEELDRLPVGALRGITFAEQCTCTCLHAPRPIGGSGVGTLKQPRRCRAGQNCVSRPTRSLEQFGHQQGSNYED